VGAAGYISYPRTETTSYAPNFDLLAVVAEHADHPDWGAHAAQLVRGGITRPKKARTAPHRAMP
jgi:DNA topoisomerase-3